MLHHRRHDVLRHAAPVPCSSSSPSACTIHQAAAAWAWFEHGGSTCITPRKAQGLISARRLKSTTISVPDRPSRFRQEILRHSPIHLYSCQSAPDPASCAEDDIKQRRRHSFHNYDLTESSSLMTTYSQRFSSSCRSVHNSPCFDIVDNADQKPVDDEEGGNTSFKGGASSLLDKFEVDAVRSQLHHHFSSHGSISCRASSACSAKLCEETHQAQNDGHHDHPQAHLKHHRNYAKWSDAAPNSSADSEHHHTINGVVHWLLHLRIKMTSSHSTSASRPVLCSSIATANSIIDYHHDPASPKGSRAVTSSRATTKRQQDAIYGRSPNRPYHSDAIYFKAFHESLGSHSLPHKSAMLDQNMKGDNQLRDMDDRVLRRKGHNHFHKHHHIHHFHHHYHHLQHVDYEPQDALRLQDYQVIDKDGLHVRQY